MANIDAPFGLRPVGTMSGSPWQASVRKFAIASGYATALYKGDPVTLAGSSDTLGHYPTIQKATAGDGNPWIGAIVGFVIDPTDLTKMYSPASTAGYAFVCTAPDAIYEIQDDGGAALAATSVGLNAVFIFTHSGNTTTGLSGAELDAGTTTAPSADASNQMIILGVANKPNNALGVNCVWNVMAALHKFKATGDGDGILGV